MFIMPLQTTLDEPITWLLQRGIVCISKLVHRNRMEQNRVVFDFISTLIGRGS